MTAECDCILAAPGSPWEGHTNADHEREQCKGTWTDEPPCGGCINCDMARAYYYRSQAAMESDGRIP